MKPDYTNPGTARNVRWCCRIDSWTVAALVGFEGTLLLLRYINPIKPDYFIINILSGEVKVDFKHSAILWTLCNGLFDTFTNVFSDNMGYSGMSEYMGINLLGNSNLLSTGYNTSRIIAIAINITTGHFAISREIPAIPSIPIIKKIRARIRKITTGWIRSAIICFASLLLQF
jgi:hypothetical protein